MVGDAGEVGGVDVHVCGDEGVKGRSRVLLVGDAACAHEPSWVGAMGTAS